MTTLDKSILTPIVASEEELAKRIGKAKNLHIKTISVWGEYTSHFFKLFLERQKEGYVPLPETATNRNDFIKINMTKPGHMLESEYEEITSKVTKEYEEHIQHKEDERKKAIKREQARIKAEREKRELEDEFLNSVINAKI